MYRFLSLKGITAYVILPILFISCGPAAKDNTSRREIEENSRLAANYRQMEGTYSGVLYADDARELARPVVLTLTLVHVADGIDENRQVRFRPELRGFFRWGEDTFGRSAVPLVGRVYLKGNLTEAVSRHDIASLMLESLSSGGGPNNGTVNRHVSMELNVSGDHMSGSLKESNSIVRTGFVEFKLE